jgi:hypothetical protein
MTQSPSPVKRQAVPKRHRQVVLKRLRKLLKHPLFTAAIGGILGFSLPLLYGIIVNPPPASTVADLMNQESLAAKMHNITVVSRIYASDAVVTDAGCQSPGASTVWTGEAQIMSRYNALPAFSSLEHVNVHVNWEPDFSWATKADATAETVGVIVPSGGSQQSQFIVGHEQWTFAHENGHWVITSFTYNLCIT